MKPMNAYADFLRRQLRVRRPLRVVLDCSNGTAGNIAKLAFKNHSHLSVTYINNRADGNFPAHGPNPLAPGALRQLSAKVKAIRADVGVILDADGDRVFFVDTTGRAVDSDVAAYLISKRFRPPYALTINAGKLFSDTSTVLCQVGHFYFKRLMRAQKISFGAERSGHYYFKKFFYCDSGLVAAIELFNTVSNSRKSLAELITALPHVARLPEENLKIHDVQSAMQHVRAHYAGEASSISDFDGLRVNCPWGWFSMRVSNTENVVRINMEANLDAKLKEEWIRLRELLKR